MNKFQKFSEGEISQRHQLHAELELFLVIVWVFCFLYMTESRFPTHPDNFLWRDKVLNNNAFKNALYAGRIANNRTGDIGINECIYFEKESQV